MPAFCKNERWRVEALIRTPPSLPSPSVVRVRRPFSLSSKALPNHLHTIFRCTFNAVPAFTIPPPFCPLASQSGDEIITYGDSRECSRLGQELSQSFWLMAVLVPPIIEGRGGGWKQLLEHPPHPSQSVVRVRRPFCSSSKALPNHLHTIFRSTFNAVPAFTIPPVCPLGSQSRDEIITYGNSRECSRLGQELSQSFWLMAVLVPPIIAFTIPHPFCPLGSQSRNEIIMYGDSRECSRLGTFAVLLADGGAGSTDNRLIRLEDGH
ncbi:hypothetical protein CDAR_60321 [Caerostris darwini]|uniref:Uncharacterized protein n=1 Tax=Caerostris darwini TaxID=1538125 RepID=A0AAV4QKS1_9ARAC|nr:hypothetical protein CDAR_60321 [Caerostris darwini]